MFHVRQKKIDKNIISQNIAMIQSIISAIHPGKMDDNDTYKIYQGLHCLLHGYISIKRNNRIPMGDDDSFKILIDEALLKFVDQV